jgi:hypothetical protein
MTTLNFPPSLSSAAWHQFNLKKMLTPARFLVLDVMRVPRRSAAARVLTLVGTFAVSGVQHLATDAAIGILPPQSGALIFFAEQPLGILLEEAVLTAAEAAAAAFRSNRRRSSLGRGRISNGRSPVAKAAADFGEAANGTGSEPHWAVRAAGYAWVVAWLSWTAPRWMYPILYRMEGTDRDMVLPFSLAQYILGM